MRNGWHTKRIAEFCDVIAGQSPEGKSYNTEGNGTPFYQGKKDFGEKFIKPPTAWTTQPTKMARRGDILMSVRAPVGPINFTAGDVCIGRGLAAIRSGKEIEPDFLFYQLLSLQPSIAGNAGAVFPSINKSEIEQIEIAAPALPEQRRIVGILDKAFAAIATAEANTERSLQNARALFDSHLTSVFGSTGADWTRCRLADCLELITYGFTNPMPTAQAGPYMVTAKNVTDGRINYASSRHTSREAFDKLLTDKSRPRVGDVLLTKDGTLGRLAVVEKANLCINQSVALLRPNGRMEPHFMKYQLSSPAYQSLMIGNADGATIKHIYITRVDKMNVAFPRINEQRRIVDRLNELAERSQLLVRTCREKLDALEALKKSLLHKAFTGAF